MAHPHQTHRRETRAAEIFQRKIEVGDSYSAPRNANRSRNSTESTQMSGLICLILPVPILMKVKESRPRLSPVAMLKVSGVAIDVMKAGNASVKSSQSTLA